MNSYVEAIERIEAIVTLPTTYTNDTIVLYEGDSTQKATVGIAMDLSAAYRNQPPEFLTRERMLMALPSRDEILCQLDHADAKDVLELRELVWLALTEVNPDAH